MATDITPANADKLIDQVLHDPSVHQLTKDTVASALMRDTVDAYYDVLLAAQLLGARMQNRLHGSGATMPKPF